MDLEEFRNIIENSDEQTFFEKVKNIDDKELERLQDEYDIRYRIPREKIRLKRVRIAVVFLLVVWLSIYLTLIYLIISYRLLNSDQFTFFSASLSIPFILSLIIVYQIISKKVDKMDINDIDAFGFDYKKLKYENTYIIPSFKDKIVYYFVLPFYAMFIVMPLFYLISLFAPYPIHEATINMQIVMWVVVGYGLPWGFFLGYDPFMQRWLRWKKRREGY